MTLYVSIRDNVDDEVFLGLRFLVVELFLVLTLKVAVPYVSIRATVAEELFFWGGAFVL